MRNEDAVLVGAVPRTKDVFYKTVRIRLYSIGWLSFVTYVARVTLRLWERKGIFPKPMFVLAGRNRWYTPYELEAYSKAIMAHYQDRKNSSLASLRVKLHDLQIQARRHYAELAKQEPKEIQVLHAETQLVKNIKRTRIAKLVKRSTLLVHETETDHD